MNWRPNVIAEPRAERLPSGDAAPEAKATRFVVPDLCNVPALAVVVLIGELLVLVLLFAGGPLTWQRLALMSLYVQWVVLMSAGMLCWVRGRLAHVAVGAGALVSFAVVMAVTLTVSLVADRVLAGTFDVRETRIAWSVIASQLAIAAIITALVLRYFYVQQQLREQEQSELQARLQALQSRIRPHFLFNSMNIIASLIPTDPETAESVVEDLSMLFRASLNETGSQVPLDEELALCRRYARIERLRLGDRLAVEWDVGAFPPGVRIPMLTLQPLLENAIYHGIQPLPEGGKITLRLRHESGLVRVQITNPLPPSHLRARNKGNRMAIGNIRSRLHMLYGKQGELTAHAAGEVYVTALSYPHVESARAEGEPAHGERAHGERARPA